MIAMFPVTAYAGGFSINENSALDMGRANTGRVTQTDDASAAYGNPALMVHYDNLTISNTLSYISGSARFEDTGSVDLTGQSLGGDTQGFFDSAIVPSLQVVYPISEGLAAGFSLNAPYGLSSTYEDGWAGRYQGLGSKLTTINANPSLAYAFNDQFSIGGGVNVQYAKATLSSAVDFGVVCFSQLGAAGCAPLGLTPQNADGRLEVEGTDWSFGYNIGASFTPSSDVTFGIHYRSKVHHDIEGDADFTVPSNAMPLTAAGAFQDTPGMAKLPLPGILEAGIGWQVSDSVGLYANVIRTNWSDLEELRIDFENPAQPDAHEELNYRDATRFGVGVDYRVNNDWTVRAGYSYDGDAATREFPTVRIPDNDRNIYAVGVSYSGVDHWQFDAAFNRFDFKETDFRRTGPSNDLVRGNIQSNVNVFSIGATKRF